MSRKDHQRDPNADESTESCDENQNDECKHIHKSVDLGKLKKTLQKGFKNECEECKGAPPIDLDMDMEIDIEFDNSLWMCLKCGNHACGRAKNRHALKHFETPHSDKHSMAVNTSTWSVWCYECDDEVNITCKAKLLEAVEYLRKHVESKMRTPPVVDRVNLCLDPLTKLNTLESYIPYIREVLEISTAVMPYTGDKGAVPKVSASSNNVLPRPRGLSNLGNTCFFNSVMQCLGQTPYLLQLLDETSQPGQEFRLPGGPLNPDDKDSPIAEPLEGTLEKWRPLTASLAETLRELQSGRAEVYNPRMLFSRLTSRMPQFGGGDQHDSHELLRHLLEAVREEDLKRYQAVILEKLGYSLKTDPSTVDEAKKKIVKFYGQQASDMQLATEQVFRGVLVSTLKCLECNHTSHRAELFLDLSLPISEKQIPPVLRRKAEELEDNKPSKHQLKKEKRAERKKNKKQKNTEGQYSHMAEEFCKSFYKYKPGDKSESESDADVEDNAEEMVPSRPHVADETSKGMESGYNSDKVDNSSPDSNNRGASPDMTVDDSGVPSPTIGMLSASPVSPENSPTSSETNIDMGSPLCGHNSPNEDVNEDLERPESRLSFVHNKSNDLKVGLAKLSLMNDGDTNKIGRAAFSGEGAGACGGQLQEDEKMDEDVEEDPTVWNSTMSARYQCEEGECSVESCLNQFTTWELMNGTNKVACELCTKRHGGPDKETVYTNATKQLLIYNPPAVLILHLKRFQVFRFRAVKVSKNVKIPMVLDLAHFCSKRSRNLPSFESGQTKVLYSLYGVVEHSGSIHAGHYVAYVKVRPPLEPNSYRWQFLPKNQREKTPSSPKGAQGEPEPPPGKWYYISDSYVSEVPQSKVLSSQAYLLFYERIM